MTQPNRTFEELLEIATWAQLGLHNKPIGILDVSGYYRPLVALHAPDRRGPRHEERGEFHHLPDSWARASRLS